MDSIKDVQSLSDDRNIDIDKVGVKNIRYPILVLDKKGGYQHTVAKVDMFVNLPHHFKGTHMSRFVEILNKYRDDIAIKNLSKILREMKEKLDAKSAHLHIEFPYFIEKRAPVSGEPSLMEYMCSFYGESNEKGKDRFIIGVKVPVMTLCPCSKEISRYGAHNQRGIVSVKLTFKGFIWIEDIVDQVESCASSPVYALLKRVDEKFVTEHAYEHPAFVEDVVRCVAKKFLEDENITWFSVEAENFESIHNHNAYAYIERSKEDG